MHVWDAKHFDVYSVTDGVYAAIVKGGTGAIGNAGFVDIGESILVFDSFNTPQAAAELREVIESLTGKPISYLINSHWHGDHVRGNQIFRDVSIVASERTRTLMQEVHPSRIERQRAGIEELRNYIRTLEEQRNAMVDKAQVKQLTLQISTLKDIEASLPTLELVLPNETFESEWCVERSDRTLICQTLGGGHTACDAVLFIPDAKVCFIGDLVSVKNHMMIADGDIYQWISILETISSWDIEYVVPGHGAVDGSEWIGQAKQYLQDLVDTSHALREQGVTAETLTDVPIPDSYQDWAAPEVYARNIKYLLRG